MIDFTKLIEYSRIKLVTEKTAHDFSHSERVLKIATFIGEKYDADIDIIKAASITHDIIDKKVAKNVDVAKDELRDTLFHCGYTKSQVNSIFSIIENMSFSSGRIPTSLEGKIVQDADRLEAIGAIAIARTFAYGGSKGRLIYAENDDESGIAHFYDKLLTLKDTLNTNVARKIAAKRHNYMKEYLKQFFIEWNLEDIE